MSKIQFNFEIQYTVTEIHEIELPDDDEALKALYEDLIGGAADWNPNHRDEAMAIEEMQRELARELINGNQSRFLGVEMIQDENSEMYVSRRVRPDIRPNVTPTAWARIISAICMTDPLDQLCEVTGLAESWWPLPWGRAIGTQANYVDISRDHPTVYGVWRAEPKINKGFTIAVKGEAAPHQVHHQHVDDELELRCRLLTLAYPRKAVADPETT